MFPTPAMRLLINSIQFNYGEWPALLESRRKLIRQLLESGDLPTLGELACLRHEYTFKHPIANDSPEVVGDEDLSLKTKGIFQAQPWDTVEHVPGSGYQPGHNDIACSDGTVRAWGLTSSNEWIVAEISFVGQRGWKGRGYEKSVTVKITKVELEDMLEQTKVNPQLVWNALGDATRAWKRRCRNLYEVAEDIAGRIELEDCMLSGALEKGG